MHKMSCSGGSQQDESFYEKKHKGSNWTEEETRTFIALCIEKRIMQMMDGKRYKHMDIYNSLEPTMKEMGFIKSGAQMKIKLKHLKEMYFKCKRNNNISGAARQIFHFYDEMEQLLSGRPSAQVTIHTGIDSSNIAQEENEEETFEAEDNMNATLIGEIENDENMIYTDVSNNTSPLKKRKTGRNTHMKLAENFAEVFAKKQAEAMQKVMKEQIRMFDEAINTQMENQRQWEKEMMEKEHQHQIMVFDNFMKTLAAMQTANIQYPQFSQASIPVHSFSSTSGQHLYPYQLSPSSSLSRSSTPSSPCIIIPSSPSPTSINPPETNISILSPSTSSSYNAERA